MVLKRLFGTGRAPAVNTKAVFPRVVDNGKMLRNFVQIVRSGVVGRRSFGTAPKRAAQAWFASRTPETIFRNALGGQPSTADVIKMVRPAPRSGDGRKDAVREALYGYLIGKAVDAEQLPPVVKGRNSSAEVIAFSDDVVKMPRPMNPRDSVMTNAQYLASLPSGGTVCSAPLRHLNEEKARGDLVVYVSDNQSWADFARKGAAVQTRGTVMAEEWERFRARNPRARLVLIDLQPYGSTQVGEREDVLNVGGFSDAVFEIVSLFAKGELGSSHFVGAIEGVKLS